MSYRDLFLRLNEEGIKYVVPRRYDALPEDTIDGDGDVDIVLDPKMFQNGAKLCESLGFTANEDESDGRIGMIRKGVQNPGLALQVLKQDPKKLIGRIITGDSVGSGDSRNPRHKNRKLNRGTEVVDLRNNLAYRSPQRDVRIPVDPSVTEGMLARRQKNDCFYVPAPSDELAHLIPHCVFNKEGRFPRYYVNRCDVLFEQVESDEQQLRLYRELLREIFFEAGDLVFNLLKEGRYPDIRSELTRFSDY